MKSLRVLAVLGGLAIAGAITGAITGVAVAGLLGMLLAPRDVISNASFVFGIASAIGAVCGFLLAPFASFSFMRHVPLGRVFAETTLGAILGGALGFGLSGLNLIWAIIGAAGGFFYAAVRLAEATSPKALAPDPAASE